MEVKVAVDGVNGDNQLERYSTMLSVRGGGKWKRMILQPAELKSEISGMPLKSFAEGQALLFDCEDEESEYAVTNILWL